MNVYQIYTGRHTEKIEDFVKLPTQLVVKDNIKEGALYKANKFLNTLRPEERKLITGDPFNVAVDAVELKNEVCVLG